MCGALSVRIEKGKLYAVITGDIVKSSELDVKARRALFGAMREVGGQLRDWLGETVMPYPLDIFGGDGWQLLLADPARALDAAVFFRAGLMARMGKRRSKYKVDTRMVIAIGEVDFIPGNRVSEGEGWAFRESGRALADKKTVHRMRLLVADKYSIQGWKESVILLDAILRWRLTQVRAKVLVGALSGLGQREIGDLMSPRISQPSVARHLKSMDWVTVSECLREFANQWHRGRLLKGAKAKVLHNLKRLYR